MAEKGEYLDFDLLIERSGDDKYRARVLSSPAGQAVKDITIPSALSGIELENFLLKIGRPRRNVRRLESSDMEAVKTFGGKLYKSIFDDELLNALNTSLAEAKKQNIGLRLRLRLNDAPELVNLPWEYLYNPSLNRFLSLSVNTPLVRYLELPERIVPLTVQLPLRVLVMISSPTDYPSLDVEQEWANLKSALCGLEERGLMIVERLDEASPVALQYALRRKDYHIFHFIGHGGFNEQAQDGILLFEDSDHRGHQLSGQYLGTLLHDEQTLRLVVLNACEGGRSGATDPFAGVAQSLVQQGLPAVVAMQIEITDDAAIAFAKEFYTALAEDFPVDAAMSEARKAIFSLGNEIEWATPVLYMRAPDGRIFDVDKTTLTEAALEEARKRVQSGEEVKPASRTEPGAKESELDLEAIYIDGLSAYWLKDWAKAWQHFHQVELVDPTFKDLPSKLEEVKKQLTIATLTEDADREAKLANWDGVVGALEKLLKHLPNDSTLIDRLEDARVEAKLCALYGQAEQLYQAKQWKAVINVFDQIHSIRPGYPDPDELLSTSQHEADEADRQWQLKTLYAQALKAMETSAWQEASSLFSQVQALDPDYRDTNQHLGQIQTKLGVPTETSQEPEPSTTTTLEVSGEPEQSPETVPQAVEPVHAEVAPIEVPTAQTASKTSLAETLRGLPKWIYFAAGGAVLVIILMAVFMGGGTDDPTKKVNQPPTEVVAVVPASATPTKEKPSTPTRPAPTSTPTKEPTSTDVPEEPTLEPTLEDQQLQFDESSNYFFDDFSTKAILWPEITAGRTTILIENGSYIFHMKEPDDNIVSEIPLLDSMTNIDFNATILAGADYGSYGVYCYYPDSNAYYEVRLGASYPEYSFWKIVDDEWYGMLPGEFVTTNILDIGDGASNDISILCQPGYIELIVNSELIERQDLDTVTQPGKMEFILDTWGDEIGPDGFQLAIDNVQVSSQFYENFTTNVHEWSQASYEGGYSRLENDGYTIQITLPDWYIWNALPSKVFDEPPTEIWFSTSSDSTDGSYGVYCNYIDEDNQIEFRFEAGGSDYSIWQTINGDLTSLLDEDFISTSNLSWGQGAYNYFGIGCTSNEISLYINGEEEQRITLAEQFSEPGRIALFAQTWDTFQSTHTVIFDDFIANR